MQATVRGFLTPAMAVLAVAGASPLLMAQNSGLTVEQYQQQEHQTWRETMHRIPAPQGGCFHASFPSIQWEKVTCAEAPGYRSAKPRLHAETLGNGYDFVAQAPSGHLIGTAVGSFPKVSGVTSEKTVNVPFGSGESSGITGKNQYTLQINTNFAYTSACNGYTGCRAWQQYVISTDTPVSLTSNQLTGKTEVFIEYWLVNYGQHTGRNICPTGFLDGGQDAEGNGDDCVQNTPAVVVYNGQLPITDLASLQLTATAVPNGTDKATATFGTDAYTATVQDSLTDISAGWNQAEFNVVGNAGGAQAAFNKGASLTVKVGLTDGSTTAPTCLAPSSESGTTGETNNLTAGGCTAGGGASPYIQFTESR